MKLRKIIAAYDKRQQEYEKMIREMDPKKRPGYKRPGSRNPKRVRG